jgi:hypothetical protein
MKFTEFFHKKEYEYQQALNEKQIVYNGGKSYGQVVFLAGGAGSGKGFAISNFMEGPKFKVIDVDELKMAFQKLDYLNKFTMKQLLDKYGSKIKPHDMETLQKEVLDRDYSMKNLNLRTPEHVFALHVLVRATGAKDKLIDMMLNGAKEGKLPNIIFDTTFKDMDDLNTYVPKLMRMGYDPKSIHITWVLTNYQVAIKNNSERPRVVPADILLATHQGAARTVFELVKAGLPKEIDGGFYVVLNNRENTIVWTDPKTGKPYKNMGKYDNKNNLIVKDFKYLTLKRPGKAMEPEVNVKKELFTWIKDNVPPNSLDTTELDKL